jgi:hypothetical protein
MRIRIRVWKDRELPGIWRWAIIRIKDTAFDRIFLWFLEDVIAQGMAADQREALAKGFVMFHILGGRDPR